MLCLRFQDLRPKTQDRFRCRPKCSCIKVLPLFQRYCDYEAFERVLDEILRIRHLRICAYCLLPNQLRESWLPVRQSRLGSHDRQTIGTGVHVTVPRASKTQDMKGDGNAACLPDYPALVTVTFASPPNDTHRRSESALSLRSWESRQHRSYETQYLAS